MGETDLCCCSCYVMAGSRRWSGTGELTDVVAAMWGRGRGGHGDGRRCCCSTRANLETRAEAGQMVIPRLDRWIWACWGRQC
jgi:hypothetical protein